MTHEPHATQHPGPVCVLVGAPGAGKTTVGAELAARHGRTHLDTDEMVERAAGKSVGEIFIEDGEDAFRALEHEAVLSALGQSGAVVSTGGGAVLDPALRAAMLGHPVIWLTVGVGAAAPRLGLDAPRPLLQIQPRATWRRLLAAREAYYAEVADRQVDTDELDIVGVCQAVEEALGWTR